MIEITGQGITLEEFSRIVFREEKITITVDCMDRSLQTSGFLKDYADHSVIYGVNTGFGPMAQYYIGPEEQINLQYNLVRSHASGAGNPLGFTDCRALMLARLSSLAQGYSGIHPQALEVVAAFLNEGLHPYIPAHGGVGASGDLVQLAHLALNLLGEGEMIRDGRRVSAAGVLAEKQITPLSIRGREGLAVLNGTSVMTGIGLVNLLHARNILELSIAASAFLNELMGSFDDHFSAELNQVKQHPGQQEVAAAMRRWLEGSGRIRRRNLSTAAADSRFSDKVQEYYSLRCVPQILGPVMDTLQYAESVVVGELNSVSDNPVVDMENGTVWHGGNFHGDYVSLEMDKLRLALTKVSMMAERQINYLAADYLNHKFPPFLNPGKPGLNFGIQGLQFTATSTVAENQALSTSLYIHSIPTNGDNQDVVSMGTNSALQTARVVENCYQVLAIEWISLVRAYALLQDTSGIALRTRELAEQMQQYAPALTTDEPLYRQVEEVCNVFRSRSWTLKPQSV